MLDFAVIIILTLFMLYGIRTGFARMALRMCSVLLSVLLAWFLYSMVSDILSKFFFESLSEMIRLNYIEPNMSGMFDNASNIPAFLQGFLQAGAESAAQTAAVSMSDSLARLILNVAAFLLVFLLSRMILTVLTQVLDIITRLPLIKQCNKLGGGILGVLEGGLAVYLILALIFLIAPVRDSDIFQNQLQSSAITRQMYNDNIIIKMVAPSGAPSSEGGMED